MTFEKVAKLLAEHLDIDASAITKDSKFSDLGIDSLDTVEILMSLEDEFGIEFDVSESTQTIGDLVKFIDANAK